MNDNENSAYMTVRDKLLLDSDFARESEKWIDALLNEYNGDYDLVMSEMCQLMNSAFHTSSDTILAFAPDPDIKRVESILSSLLYDEWTDGPRFHYSRLKPKPGENEGWILKKQMAGKTDVITIEICPEKYFFINAEEPHWYTYIYSYKVLMYAIDGWIISEM